jgi:4-amino-4-deoxy-L-arabinose transferase-like glycosyltransferase
MLDLLRRNPRFFAIALSAGLLLRILFLVYAPSVVNDSFIYGDIAKNWLQHGVYGVTDAGRIVPTFIRLPGYPAFLAFVFAIFGLEHYRAVLILQLFVDLGTCLLCASIAFRLLGERSAKAAFLLAALCPFLANYSAAALTETLEVFFTALAFDALLRALASGVIRDWILCGFACSAATLLRPDGALLPLVIVLYLLSLALFPKERNTSRTQIVRAAFLVAMMAVLPLIPWTIRNWYVLHRFQPLAPRYANEEAEFVPIGFNRWVKTWIVDYASTEEIYWAVPGNPMDVDQLPKRAFDSQDQREATERLLADYNQVLHITPALDARFAALARQRAKAHPIRTHVVLPTLRIADMWLRPRTEMLPSDTRWWEFNDDPKWSALAVSLGVVSLFYWLCGLVGSLRMLRVSGSGALWLFVVLRSLFLGTLENPEPRYTLEMYPILIIFAAVPLVRLRNHFAGPEA